MTSWRIIRSEMPDGSVEFQVSDGPRGNRSTSYDFDNLKEAEEMLSGLLGASVQELQLERKSNDC